MVLRLEPTDLWSRRLNVAALCLWVCVLTGCLKSKPPTKLSEPTPIAVAYVLEFPDRPEIAPVPESFKERVTTELGRRNLQPKEIDISTLREALQRKRETRDRVQVIAQKASGAPLVLLVETKARYYSILEGRYRWEVSGRATFAPIEDLARSHTTDFSRAAFLEYDHQKESEALQFVQRAAAEWIGKGADRFLTGLEDVSFEAPPENRSSEPKEDDGADAIEKEKPEASRYPEHYDAVYFIMVDRFENGDTSNDGDVDPDDPQAFHGGDLQGVIERLDWLEKLGVRTVWLSPVFETRTEKFHGHGAFHGYWLEDFSKIEPRFGDAEKLVELAAELEERDMRLLLDVVLNHVGPDTPLVTEKPSWFHGKGGITDWSDTQQVLTHDVHGLPDLAQEKPEVFDYLSSHSLYWIEKVGPEGFRLDAVKHVPNSFWQRYNSELLARAGPDFLLLGELLDGNPATVAATMREGGFNAMFDFPLHFALVDVFCDDVHPGRLASVLYADRVYPAELRREKRRGLVTLLDNHDLPRILSACGEETDRVRQALRFMLTARGTPSFTWGTEVGLVGEEEPANRADMRFEELHPIGESMTRLLELRRENPVLATGRDTILEVTDDVFAYVRAAADQAVIVVVNRGEKPATVELPTYLESTKPGKRIDTSVEEGQVVVRPGKVGIALFSGQFRNVLRASGPPRKRPVVVRVVGVTPPSKGEPRLVGSGPELGDWDPSAGVKMKATRAGYEAELELPVGSAFAFKVAAPKEDGGWEWMPDENNYLFVDHGEGRLSYKLAL